MPLVSVLINLRRTPKTSVGMKRKSWHAIRHTYISLSRELGVPMEIVIQNTGDTAATILKYYSKPSPEFIRKTIQEKQMFEVK